MFSSMRFDPFLSLTDGSGRGAHGSRAPRRGDSDYDLAEQNPRHSRSRDLAAHDPFNFASSMMSNMNAMMGNMHKFMVSVKVYTGFPNIIVHYEVIY